MRLQTDYELRILIVDYVNKNGLSTDIYNLIDTTNELSPAQLRLVLRELEIEGYLNISYSSKQADRFGFRPIAEIRLML